MQLFRIGDERHPIWDGSGASWVGGRWNSVGRPLIYASTSYACAMLELLAHASIGRIPMTHRFVCVAVPADVSIEKLDMPSLPDGWDAPDSPSAKAFGDLWIAQARSAILLVPSVVARLDFNALVNPLHPHARLLQPSAAQEVVWDKRLFSRLQ